MAGDGDMFGASCGSGSENGGIGATGATAVAAANNGTIAMAEVRAYILLSSLSSLALYARSHCPRSS